MSSVTRGHYIRRTDLLEQADEAITQGTALVKEIKKIETWNQRLIDGAMSRGTGGLEGGRGGAAGGRVHYYGGMVPAGFIGSHGEPGSGGGPGVVGEHGKEGTLKIVVKSEGLTEEYDSPYDLELTIPRLDYLEPGTELELPVTVKNTGGMPTPTHQAIRLLMQKSENLIF